MTVFLFLLFEKKRFNDDSTFVPPVIKTLDIKPILLYIAGEGFTKPAFICSELGVFLKDIGAKIMQKWAQQKGL